MAREAILGILNGTEIIPPDERSRPLYEAFPQRDPAIVNQINAAVQRRPGYDNL